MNKHTGDGFLGYKFFIVLSDSMKPEFQAGDVIITKVIDEPSELKVGDVITFYSIDPASYGEIITHEIQEKTTYESKDAFTTKGTNVNQPDEYPALVNNVIGEYSFSLPKMGYLFQFLKTPLGYFTLILTPFLLIMLYNGTKFVKVFKEYKKEQKLEMENQKKQLEEERQKNEKVLEELKSLKEQLGTNLSSNGELN